MLAENNAKLKKYKTKVKSQPRGAKSALNDPDVKIYLETLHRFICCCHH